MLLERPTLLDSEKIKTFIIKSKSGDFITLLPSVGNPADGKYGVVIDCIW